MSSRPEALFPLFADLTSLAGVGPRIAENMTYLAITKPRDLLFTLPHSGIDRSRQNSVNTAVLPGVITVGVEIGNHTPSRTKAGAYRIAVTDAETSFQLVYFHARGDYLLRLLPPGSRRIVSGKVEQFDGMAQMVHPDHTVSEDDAAEIPGFEPVYPVSYTHLTLPTTPYV